MSKETNSSGLLPHKYNECYQCQRRQLGCHSHCAAYLAFHEKRLAEAKARETEHKAIDDHFAVFSNRQKANARARRSKRR